MAPYFFSAGATHCLVNVAFLTLFPRVLVQNGGAKGCALVIAERAGS